MKTYYNILKSASLLAMMSLIIVSCDDWLTVHPQTQIVEENFWEDKTDLEGVRYAAYKRLSDQVEKMIIWGDVRSDIYQIRTISTSDQGHRDNFSNIRKAVIDTTLTYYDWSGMYSAIGYCNKVLQHGEEILEKDKQFTASEWTQMEAEMVTIRALCYFYLVRAFKNIPYTTKVINSDSEVEYFPQVPALEVMDELIADVERVAGRARNRFVNREETKGMITNTAIYALLSDMYLWRASMLQGRGTTDMAISDYKKCIENSELSIAKLKDQFDEETKGVMINKDKFLSWENAPKFAGKNVDFMYKNDISNAGRGKISMYAYSQIFSPLSSMNSYESIFELQFSSTDGRKNTFTKDIWGYSNTTTLTSSTTISGQTNDMRNWINGWQHISGVVGQVSDSYVLKWCTDPDITISENIGQPSAKVTINTVYYDYNNWIIWRLSDMLMNNAEARACLADLNVDKEDNAKVCNQLLRMVNRRWWVDLTLSDVEVATNLTDHKTYDMGDGGANNLLQLVMDTRKLEFVAEGKRWFDLVRFAERNSSNDEAKEGMEQIYDAFMNSLASIDEKEAARSRCENLWGLYCPIFYMECKAYRVGGVSITQNPVWNKSKYERK